MAPVPSDESEMTARPPSEEKIVNEHDTLKYSLLGPSLTKSGQDSVDQQKVSFQTQQANTESNICQVSEIIYNASKGSKYFNNEEARDKNLTQKIERILAMKKQLEKLDLASDRRKADEYIAELELSRDLSQVVVHIDCDAFYAAVEELDRPELKDVPFAVGKGVLTTCNYLARKFGCRSGMAGFVAKKLCPELIQLPLNFDKYTAKAQEVREIIVDYDPRFESASIDEAYLNITEYCQRNDINPEEAVQQLRREVHEKTKITISAGIAANAKLAKICSNKNKPNGQFSLPRDRNTIMAFMRDLPTRKVNGVGRVFERELDAIGVKTCGDIYQYRQYLSKLFGEKAFAFLMQCYLGLGRTKVQPAEEYERKSVGTESTFGDTGNPVELRDKLRATAEELEKDMVRTQFKGRTLCLKVKLHTFEIFTRQAVVPKAVYLADDLYKYSVPMLAKLEQEFPGMRLRLMGLRCTHLVSMKKPDTMAFFGFKKKNMDTGDSVIPDTAKRKADALDDDTGQWEAWPDELLFEDAERQEREDEMQELETLSQEIDKRRHHGKEIVPNPKKENTLEEEWWDCPICSRPQAASEREFNEHIDLCLSRQTIRDAVQETSESRSRDHTPAPKKARSGNEKGRDKAGVAGDSKQRRLCFG
jgi:DNA polymerase kappa